MLDQALHTVTDGVDAEPSGSGESVGGGVDADEDGDLEVFGEACELDDEVGSDVSGADDGNFGSGHGGVLLISGGERGADVADTGDGGGVGGAGMDGHHRSECAGEHDVTRAQ